MISINLLSVNINLRPDRLGLDGEDRSEGKTESPVQQKLRHGSTDGPGTILI